MNATDRLALLAGTEGLVVVANTASDDSSTLSLSGRRALQILSARGRVQR